MLSLSKQLWLFWPTHVLRQAQDATPFCFVYIPERNEVLLIYNYQTKPLQRYASQKRLNVHSFFASQLHIGYVDKTAVAGKF